MNCDDYLAMLATLPVGELAYGRAGDHAASCRDCDRVTRVVAERERNMLTAYGDLQFSVPAEQIAERALVASRRRTVALYYRIGLGVAMVATVLFMILSLRVGLGPQTARVSETAFHLQCLSPEQAAEVLRSQLQPSTSIRIRPDSPLGIIRVAGSPDEMARARALLERYDTPAESQCAVQVAVPKAP